MDDGPEDGFDAEENYYAFLNISKSASLKLFEMLKFQF